MNNFWQIITADENFAIFTVIAMSALKATILLGLVNLIVAFFHRISAATRHLLWTFALCAALFLPFLSFLSFWEIPILPNVSTVKSTVSEKSIERVENIDASISQTPDDLTIAETFEVKGGDLETNPTLQNITQPVDFLMTADEVSEPSTNVLALKWQMTDWILGIWLLGTTALLIRLLVGFAAGNFLARQGRAFKNQPLNELFSAVCAELELKNKPRLLASEGISMPIVCGVFSARVLLPKAAEKWSEERQRMVLLHELAHVARRDCLTQMLAQTACAIYWFNPFVWVAARRLRIEREQACDDRVLSIGTKPSTYAHHLLEIARLMQEKRSIFDWSKTNSVAMARKSQLEGRLLGILREENKFGAVSGAAKMFIALLMCVLLTGLAIVRPTTIKAEKSTASVESTVEFQNNSSVPMLNAPSSENAEQRLELPKENALTTETLKNQTKIETEIKPAEQTSKTELIVKNAEANETVQSKEIPAQNISETITPPVLPTVATSATPLPVAPTTSPIVKAEYRQEPKAQVKSNDFIDEMASIGFTNLSIDQLISLKIYGVTANYVRSLRELGYENLTPKVVTNLKIYNVSPSFVKALAAAGFKNLTLNELTNAKIYGITAEYAKGIQDAGFPSAPLKQIINFKIYKITPEYIRSARSRLGDLTPRQIIALKNAGI